MASSNVIETIDASELAFLNASNPEPNNVLGNIIHDLNIGSFENDGGVELPVELHIPNPPEEKREDPILSPEAAEDLLRGLDGYPKLQGVQTTNMNNIDTRQMRVEILEQPAPNKLRFRYAVEGRGAGALTGERSTTTTRTFPTIRLHGYQGSAVVIVSCVEHQALANYPNKYRPHPHKIVGKSCMHGVCRQYFSSTENMTCEFKNLGIQCMRKQDTKTSLDERKGILVDPFNTGFDHSGGSFDLNKVRLAFQVFLQVPGQNGKMTSIPVPDIQVSQTIMDRKSFGDLKIENYSDNCAPFEGSKKILLFTERVTKDDIEVHFAYTDPTDGSYAVLKGLFGPNDVHHQYGIALTTPPFPNFNVTFPVETQMYLVKKSEPSCRSESVPFTFYPTKVEEKKPVIVAARQVKRDRNAMKEENVPQEQPSTGQIALPPKGFKSGGGSVIVEPKVEKEDEPFRLSDLICSAPTTEPSMNPPTHSYAEFQKLVSQQTKETPAATALPSDDMFNGVDVDQAAEFAKCNFDSDMLSQQLSETSISNATSNSRNKNLQQNSGLDTPDVSMDQSKNQL